MGVFSLLQQIYLHNKKEQQSAGIIKGSLLENSGLTAKVHQRQLQNNVDMINYKHLEVEQKVSLKVRLCTND